jgi:glycosyltransferase involved in cell wall biosynthesis
LKVLYCIDHLRADGTQRVLTQLVAGLNRCSHQQAVLCLNDSYDVQLVAQLRAAGAEVRMVGRSGFVLGYGLLSAWRWMKRERFDSVVTLLFVSDVLGRTLAHLARIPGIITSLRARNTNYTKWQRWLVRGTMRWANKVVLNSAAVRDFAISEEGAQPDRIVVIPNGIEIEPYSQPITRAELCVQLGVSTGTLLIGSVGRLTHQKGYNLLIEALAQSALTSAHLLLMGTGEEADRLTAQARQRGISERVHLLGYRQDVPRLLGALDLYVQPSRFEGMPNAVLEAMAAGCPIVASAVDGIQELIDDGVQGWLVPPENITALAAAIDSALSDRDEAQRRAQAAQRRAAQDFSVDAMVTAWERVLDSCDEAVRRTRWGR